MFTGQDVRYLVHSGLDKTTVRCSQRRIQRFQTLTEDRNDQQQGTRRVRWWASETVHSRRHDFRGIVDVVCHGGVRAVPGVSQAWPVEGGVGPGTGIRCSEASSRTLLVRL
jgi:hypothetical protein